PLQALGIKPTDITGLFAKDVALEFAGGKTPQFTVISAVDDTQKALDLVNKLLGLAGLSGGGLPQTVHVAGLDVKVVKVNGQTLAAAVFDNKLVLASSAAAIQAVKQGPHLDGAAAFKDATSNSPLPGSVSGFLYLDVKGALPLI